MKAILQSNSHLQKNQVSTYIPVLLLSACCLAILFFPDLAHAGTGGTELGTAATKIKDLTTGTGAKAIGYGGTLACGIAAMATQKWIPFISLGASLLGLSLAPGIIDGMFTALI